MSAEELIAGESGQGGIEVEGRFILFPNKPLPELNSPSSKAYQVQDLQDSDGKRPLFVLVSDHPFPPRLDSLLAMRSMEHPNLLRPVFWQVVFWPPLERGAFTAIFEKPLGGKLMDSLASVIKPIHEENLVETFITPLVGVLKEYNARGLSHRCIRPDNLFFADKERTHILLGEGFMTPPGYVQDVMFETIENGMCLPLGRSTGSVYEDFYALGVTLLFLVSGRAPAVGTDNDTLIVNKIEQSSYAALARRERVPKSVKEFLRGVIADDLADSWSLEDIAFWLDGRRVSPQQPEVPPRANRPIRVAGRDYFTGRSLAHGLFRNWDTAPQVIQETDLETWAQRTVGDDALATGISTVMARAAMAEGDEASEMMISWLCMVMDPKGPVRYRTFSAMLDGFGRYMMQAYKDEDEAKLFTEVVFSELPVMWIHNLFGDDTEGAPFLRGIERLRYLLQQTTYGFGFERCLYELNPSMPCGSPLIAEFYVEEPNDLLPALEKVPPELQEKTLPMDRHIAAFIAGRFKHDTDSMLKDLSNRGDPNMVVLATLRMFAVMQWKMGPNKLPVVSQWIGRFLGPIMNNYHNLKTREMIQEFLPQMIKKGSLVEMLNLLDDPARRQGDINGYWRAVDEYAAAKVEIEMLTTEMETQGPRTILAGHRISSMVAFFIAVLIIATMAVTL